MHGIPLRLALAAFLVGLTSLALAAPARAQSDPAPVYKANCTLCHGADGGGNTPTGKALDVKDLRSAEVQKQTDALLAGIIIKGRDKMPAFGKKLSPDAINSLVSYIRQLAKR